MQQPATISAGAKFSSGPDGLHSLMDYIVIVLDDDSPQTGALKLALEFRTLLKTRGSSMT